MFTGISGSKIVRNFSTMDASKALFCKAVESVEDVKMAKVNLVWEPAWSKDRMSDAALLQLGLL